jgi:1,4-alpha-glucan branching enzyme
MKTIETLVQRLVERDPLLLPFSDRLHRRLERIDETASRLTDNKSSLADFASGHEYFGLHFRNNEWVLREWAPNAEAVFLVGDMSDWTESKTFALDKIDPDGVWEIRLPADKLTHRDLYRLRIHWPGGSGDRIPAYARRVVQDPDTLIFSAQVWRPSVPHRWKHSAYQRPDAPPLIYEAHVGMAQAEEKVGSFREFTLAILPRIAAAGYNTLQLMAIQEHPYYGSFGYQVSSFFAPSSRFGSPDELKILVDTAHGYGLTVTMDLIHSHAVSNEVEGLSRFDGTLYQYFHAGERGQHSAWDSRCFDYAKPQVLHFLLSNCRYWLDEFHFDGFRFDGITSMIYRHHGLGTAFTTYDDYFDQAVDEDALTYLGLANRLIHTLRPDAVTIAEDVSGLPALAVPQSEGGIGFDYRFAMGIPDYWIRLIKDTKDDDWPVAQLWFELNNRRSDEKTISYAESHDQALVGDQSIIFRLIGAEMYMRMQVSDTNMHVARGLALHKIIRLVTMATAGSGYLNFMGNEFGHPEWIDFPRQGNNWSYRYARRQWNLVDDVNLKYHQLAAFDRQMIALVHEFGIFNSAWPQLLHEHTGDKILAMERQGLIFAFNFHPDRSFTDYKINAPAGKYRLVLDSDDVKFGGHGRLVSEQIHFTSTENGTGKRERLSLYLPNRTGFVLQPID